MRFERRRSGEKVEQEVLPHDRPVFCRELRSMESKATDIRRESLELLDSAHLQCEKKIEMTENRAEKLCQGSEQTCSYPYSIWQQLLVR